MAVVVVPVVKGKVRGTVYDDDALRLWCCFRRFDIPSDGDPSGVGVSPVSRAGGRSPGSFPAVIGKPVTAVVGLAFPVTDPAGFRPIDMREVMETFEDREPGRMGDCGCGLLRSGIAIGGREGETISTTSGCNCSCGSTRGSSSFMVVSGNGCALSSVCVVIGSCVTSVDAWAKSRESDEGPAEGVEFVRDLAGNGRDVVNDSSTSGSAGTGNGSSATAGFVSISIVGDVTRLANTRRLEAWVCVCVQSSTSSI